MSESGDVAYIIPAMFKNALERAGYSADKTLRYMAENGLIATKERKDHKGRPINFISSSLGNSWRMMRERLRKMMRAAQIKTGS